MARIDAGITHRLGGDTDTVASMGALAGTFYGFEGIPRKYVDPLERADEIRQMEIDLVRFRE